MSAFIVSDDHITVMLQAARGRHPGDGHSYYWNDEMHPFNGNEQAIGQKLLDENYRSVNYRYDEQEAPRTYKPMPVLHQYKAVEILKLCNCYDYQACETPDYKTTEAHEIVDTLRGMAIRSLPGYESAAWGL